MHTATRKVHHLRNRVIDYVLYIAIAFAFIGTTFVVQTKWGHDAFIRWFGLVGFTLGLFGYFLQDSREFLRVRRFWQITAALLALHLVAFAAVLSNVSEWRLPWFIVMAFEYPVLVFFRDRVPRSSEK
jgi:hypothetical protein